MTIAGTHVPPHDPTEGCQMSWPVRLVKYEEKIPISVLTQLSAQ